MTAAELEAIRARAKDASRFTMEASGAKDCLALLAEVERLREALRACSCTNQRVDASHFKDCARCAGLGVTAANYGKGAP